MGGQISKDESNKLREKIDKMGKEIAKHKIISEEHKKKNIELIKSKNTLEQQLNTTKATLSSTVTACNNKKTATTQLIDIIFNNNCNTILLLKNNANLKVGMYISNIEGMSQTNIEQIGHCYITHIFNNCTNYFKYCDLQNDCVVFLAWNYLKSANNTIDNLLNSYKGKNITFTMQNKLFNNALTESANYLAHINDWSHMRHKGKKGCKK